MPSLHWVVVVLSKDYGYNMHLFVGTWQYSDYPSGFLDWLWVNHEIRLTTVQVTWGKTTDKHGRDLYLPKANLAPPDRYKHLKRAEEVAMTRLRIGHCKATKGHIVSRGPPAVCHHCGSTLSREHILLECGIVQELRGKFYEVDSLTSLFECVRPLAIIEYLKEAGFFYLIWQVYESEKRNVKSHKPQNPDYHIIEEDKWIAENIQKCVGRLICPEGHVSSLNKLNSIPSTY